METSGQSGLVTPSPASVQSPPTRNWWSRNWKWVVPVGCLVPLLVCGGGIALIFALVVGTIKSSDPYRQSLAMVQAHPDVQQVLGTPVEPGFWVTGSINVANSSGQADIAYSVSGPSGGGTVHVVATKSAGAWAYTTMDVDVNGRRISLVPSP